MLQYTISGDQAEKFKNKLELLNIKFNYEKGLFGFITFKIYSNDRKLTALLFHASRKKL